MDKFTVLFGIAAFMIIVAIGAVFMTGYAIGKVETENTCATMIDNMISSVASQPLKVGNRTIVMVPKKEDLNNIQDKNMRRILSKTKYYGVE